MAEINYNKGNLLIYLFRKCVPTSGVRSKSLEFVDIFCSFRLEKLVLSLMQGQRNNITVSVVFKRCYIIMITAKLCNRI